LELLAARLYPDLEKSVSGSYESETRLMVSSPTEGTKVALDDGKFADAPLIVEVTPGKHRLHIRAPGFRDEQRQVVAVKGELVALDVRLNALPGRLLVLSPPGALVLVDGRQVGQTPLVQPVEVVSGKHLVTVTKNGYVTVAREANTPTGKTTTVRVGLEPTTQRLIAWGVLGTGAAALVTGGVFVGLALNKEAKAEDIYDEIQAGGSSTERLDAYEAAGQSRDRWRTAAAITLGSGVALGVVGSLLYAFDRPGPAPPTRAGTALRWSVSPKGLTGLDVAGKF
jgi:hypothetical protein